MLPHPCTCEIKLWLLSFSVPVPINLEGVGSSCHGSAVMNPTSIHEDTGSIPGLTRWVKDPVLLWLWCRLAATVLIGPEDWDNPCATDVALKKKKLGVEFAHRANFTFYIFEVKKTEVSFPFPLFPIKMLGILRSFHMEGSLWSHEMDLPSSPWP